MTHSRTLLTFLFALLALFGRGALEYVAYDLATPAVAAVPVEASTQADTTYRTGTKMLFVRDTLLADSVYIGVYEVTQAQAYKLGWTSSEPTVANAGVAYGFNGTFAGFTANHKLDTFQLLAFPTGAQWEAYAGDKARPCNVSNGKDGDADNTGINGPITLSDWFIYAQGHTLPAPHGAFDMYGNVAEFVSEGTFRGGYAIGTCTYDSDLKSWAETTISAVDGFGMMGARLVYTPPEAITYQAIVTLDGEAVGEPISATPGTTVTLTRPTPAEGYRLQGPEVTPADLSYSGTTFAMPEANVTIAYTSKPYATVQVVGGKASVGEVFAGDEVTLTPTPGAHKRFKAWTLPDGSTSSDNPLTYTVPEIAPGGNITPGTTLTFTAIYDPEPQYAATVTLDGAIVSTSQHYAGTRVTLAEPDPGTGHRLLGPTVTPTNLAYSGTTFTMPEADVIFAYTRQAYAYIKAEGGTASARIVYAGESVTLTAAPGKYQAFKAWTLPDGTTTSSANPLTYTLQTFTPGETLTFTASFQTYPRVLVYGGTATLATGTAYGEGFYSPGATLTLSAPAPSGYTFSGWTVSAGDAPAKNTYVVGDYGSTVTVTANFSAQEAESTADTYIGEVSGNTAKGALTLGYDSSTSNTLVFGTNKFYCYQPQAATSDYAYFSLDSQEIIYGKSQRKSTARLPIKRTSYNGSTYYIGLYETSVGNVAYLKALAGKSEESDDSTSHYPYILDTKTEATTYLTYLGNAFSLSVSLPSKAQIEGITQAACKSAGRTYTGAGYYSDTYNYGDEKITTSMVVATQNGNDSAAPKEIGSQSADPYGFYDLWGNANELWSDGGGTLWGGSCREAYSNCNAREKDGAVSDNWLLPSFRPAIAVPALLKVTISVDGITKSTSVLPGQVIKLAPQVKTGYDFTGWTAKTASGTKTVAKSGTSYPYTVTEAVTLTASFTAKPVVSVAYTNCSGPTTVLPGATVTLYAANPTGDAPTSVTISPASAATWNKAAGTLTFAASASGSVTVTATYPDPTPPKPGYKVYLQ